MVEIRKERADDIDAIINAEASPPPPEAFMIKILADAHQDGSGVARYRQQFSDVS